MQQEDEYYCIGDESEVKGYKRKFLFDDTEIKGKYNLLLPEYQNIVHNVLHELIGDDEYFGFNLDRLLKSYKNASPRIAQNKISKVLADSVKDICQDEHGINNQLDYAKKRGKLRTGKGKSCIESYTKAVCDCLLVKEDLLKQGIGKIYEIKDDWFNRFINDTKNSSIMKLLYNDIEEPAYTLQLIREYEKYLRDKNELGENESILEEKWAVMTYNGAYQLLEQEKRRQNEKKAIDRLINELYVQQLLQGKMPTIEKNF